MPASYTRTVLPAGAPLRAYVDEIRVYESARDAQPLRRHPPSDTLTLIVGTGGALDITDPGGGRSSLAPCGVYLGGLQTAPAETRAEGAQSGVILGLSPIGAHRMLRGLPMGELTNRSMRLDEALGPELRELGERVAAACGARARAALVERFLRAAILDSPLAVRPEIAFVWQAIVRTGGALRIRDVAASLGWSRKRLAAEFRDAIGVPPKTAARLLRFRIALDAFVRNPAASWARIASESGFHDQAHLHRELQALSGWTPGELGRQWRAHESLFDG